MLSSTRRRAGQLLCGRASGRWPPASEDLPFCDTHGEIADWLSRVTGCSLSDDAYVALNGVECALWHADSRAVCLISTRGARMRPRLDGARVHRELSVSDAPTSVPAQREQMRSVQAYQYVSADAARRMKVSMARQLLTAAHELQPLDVVLVNDTSLLPRSLHDVQHAAHQIGVRLLILTTDDLYAHGDCEVLPFLTTRVTADVARVDRRLTRLHVQPESLPSILVSDPACVRVGGGVGDVLFMRCAAFLSGSVLDARRVVAALRGPASAAVQSDDASVAPVDDGSASVIPEEAAIAEFDAGVDDASSTSSSSDDSDNDTGDDDNVDDDDDDDDVDNDSDVNDADDDHNSDADEPEDADDDHGAARTVRKRRVN
jgi:DNA-directed RNA polymerase subunit H (RpoH/RPB5)